MEKEQYRVIILGTSAVGDEKTAVQYRLAKLFRIDNAKAAKMVKGNPVTIKRSITKERALRYKHAIQKAGALCKIELDVSADMKSGHGVIAKDINQKIMITCPKCGYQLGFEQSEGSQSDECPACGIIVSKYQQVQKSENLNDDSDHYPTTNQKHGEEKQIDMPFASLKRRILAAIYLYFIMTCIVLPFKIPIALFIRVRYGPLTGISSSSFRQARDVSDILFIVVILVVVYFVMIHVPKNNGRNWGQQLMGISIIGSDKNQIGTIKPWLLRIFGDLLTLGTFFMPTILQLFNRDMPSLGDRFSNTRQVESELMPDRPAIKALTPFAYLFIINLVTNFAVLHILQAKSTIRMKSRSVATSNNVDNSMDSEQYAKKIFQLERMFFYENTMLTNDPNLLLSSFGLTMSPFDKMKLSKQISEGRIKVRNDGTYCDIAVKEEDEGLWKVYSGDIEENIIENDYYKPSHDAPW